MSLKKINKEPLTGFGVLFFNALPADEMFLKDAMAIGLSILEKIFK